MKKIFILLATCFIGLSAQAQPLMNRKFQKGNETPSLRDQQRALTRQIMNGKSQMGHAKSTATNERMTGYAIFDQNQQGTLTSYDSLRFAYSGMRGSSFNYRSMTVGYYSPLWAPIVPDNEWPFKADAIDIYQQQQQFADW
jgi:hypothetical protein